jgi:hypothetical protein
LCEVLGELRFALALGLDLAAVLARLLGVLARDAREDRFAFTELLRPRVAVLLETV